MILILLLTIILASLEPIFSGSMLLGWSVAVGVMRRDGWGAGTAVLAGILRDVVLVSRLGASSIIFVTAWLVSALASSRFERPFVVTFLVSAAFAIVVGVVIEKEANVISIVTAVAVACVTILCWGVLLERRSGIRLREQ